MCEILEPQTLLLICGILKIKQRNGCNQTETDSQIQRTNSWLPVGWWAGEGQDRGRGIRDIKYYIWDKKATGYIVQYREYSQCFIIALNAVHL